MKNGLSLFPSFSLFFTRTQIVLLLFHLQFRRVPGCSKFRDSRLSPERVHSNDSLQTTMMTVEQLYTLLQVARRSTPCRGVNSDPAVARRQLRKSSASVRGKQLSSRPRNKHSSDPDFKFIDSVCAFASSSKYQQDRGQR